MNKSYLLKNKNFTVGATWSDVKSYTSKKLKENRTQRTLLWPLQDISTLRLFFGFPSLG